MDVKGRAVPLSWYEEISHAGSAGDAALDWGGRALCAESERVSALMSASAPRLLSLCEFRLPVKGLAGRHRLSRVPACMSISTEPQAPRMLDGPSARSDHQDVSLSSVKLQSETRVLRSAHLRPSGLAASGFYAQKKACQNESKKTAGVLAPETKTQHDQRRLGCSGRVLLLCLLKHRGLITGLVYPHAINDSPPKHLPKPVLPYCDSSPLPVSDDSSPTPRLPVGYSARQTDRGHCAAVSNRQSACELWRNCRF